MSATIFLILVLRRKKTRGFSIRQDENPKGHLLVEFSSPSLLYVHGSFLILQHLISAESCRMLVGQNISELFGLILRIACNWASSAKASPRESLFCGSQLISHSSIVLTVLSALSCLLSFSQEIISNSESLASAVIECAASSDQRVSLSQLMILSLSKGTVQTVKNFSLQIVAQCIRRAVYKSSKITYFRDLCEQISALMQSTQTKNLYFLIDVYLSFYENQDFSTINGVNPQLPLSVLLQWTLEDQKSFEEIMSCIMRSIGRMTTKNSKKLIVIASNDFAIELVTKSLYFSESLYRRQIATVVLWALLYSHERVIASTKAKMRLDGTLYSIIEDTASARDCGERLTMRVETFHRAIFGVLRCLA